MINEILIDYKNGIKKLKIMVVKGVTEKRVTNASYSIDEVVLSSKTVSAEERYVGFDYNYFRPIESMLRPYDTYLLE